MRRRGSRLRNTGTPFITTWDTRNLKTGSSASNQIKLPLQDYSQSSFDFIVDWGDGTTDNITTYNQAETLHTYATEGIKTITITGTIIGFSFYLVQSETNKILTVENWGIFGSDWVFFYLFRNCINLDMSGVQDVPLYVNPRGIFAGCRSITTVNNLNSWDTSTADNFWDMFNGCINFNQDVLIDFSNAVNIRQMFEGCTLFNSVVSIPTSGSKINNMLQTFQFAPAFNQDISDWDVSKITYGNNFLRFNTAFSTANLDLVYQKWSIQSLQSGVTIHFGSTKYTSAGQAGRDILTSSPNNWTITDGGLI